MTCIVRIHVVGRGRNVESRPHPRVVVVGTWCAVQVLSVMFLWELWNVTGARALLLR